MPGPGPVSGWTPVAGKENLWDPDEDNVTTHRMLVTDFRFGATATPPPLPLGQFLAGENAATSGPASANLPAVGTTPAFSPCEAKIVPDRLIEDGAVTPAQKSTFLVLRAISEVTCHGFLDSVDASTAAAVLKFGLFRLDDGVVSGELRGELPASGPWCETPTRPRLPARSATRGQPPNRTGTRSTSRPPAVSSTRTRIDASERAFPGRTAGSVEDPNHQYEYGRPAVDADRPGLRSWHWLYRAVRSGREVAFARALGPGAAQARPAAPVRNCRRRSLMAAGWELSSRLRRPGR